MQITSRSDHGSVPILSDFPFSKHLNDDKEKTFNEMLQSPDNDTLMRDVESRNFSLLQKQYWNLTGERYRSRLDFLSYFKYDMCNLIS